jgi:hypothetical protein
MAAIMKIAVFWNVTLCTLKMAAVGFFRNIGEPLSDCTTLHPRRRVSSIYHEAWVKTNQKNAMQCGGVC